METIRDIDFSSELSFATSRSGGKGGQNVNKVSSKVELSFHIAASKLLSEEQKAILIEKLANRINTEGEMKVVSQEDRSQLGNKEIVIEKFYDLLENALKPRKIRKKVSIPKSVIANRIKHKKRRADVKAMRRKPIL